MTTSRRQFLQLSLSAASLAALGGCAHVTSGVTQKQKRILVLGGTGFLGPAIVEAARARGHTLTLFNRGKTRPELFPDVEKLRGDRDPTKGDGLKALAGRTWDAVIDTSGYYPRIVQASADLLAPNVKQYVFISSVSVYANDDVPDQDETAPTAKLADPTVETMGPDYAYYGGLKRLCEEAVERTLPGRATTVRPGYIVGPEDRTDRFTYWPVRFDRGGEMLAPGSPSDPIQIIDVRDLAAWLVYVVERGVAGTYNAVGPDQPWTMGELIAACADATGRDTKVTWVPADFLAKHDEKGDSGIPIWLPATGKTRGMHLRSNGRAMATGLRFREPETTVRDTLAWFKGLPEERRSKLRAGLTPEREAELLALWAQARSQPAAAGG